MSLGSFACILAGADAYLTEIAPIEANDYATLSNKVLKRR